MTDCHENISDSLVGITSIPNIVITTIKIDIVSNSKVT